ncbi:MAG: hypothetical protein AUI14_21645 [Actinobacteria bacterium 13_2_20CM_2_71_6]|nr:MAG: hypothetical protein AUI14_21645 [Actinobacteria bacterium 13_2_20CM_2_71_6]
MESPPDPPPGVGLPLARTNAEAHLYLSLQPCPVCGETRGRYRSSVVTVDGDLASRYTGTCPRCGAERVFEFRIPTEVLPPPVDRVRFGADEPSQLLDPGQWLAYADDRARRVPADRSGLVGEELRAARHALATALAAVEEVLKFIPEGAEAVPADRFTTPEGRAVRDREPGRFGRARLAAVHDAYADLLKRW